ncbi:MAG: cation transporter [Nitrososphaerota archaeon]|nr:cation transporter [Nitrososphaerota archaeon]
MNGETKRLDLQIIGMSCASCAKIIRKRLGKSSGVKDVRINPIMNAIYVDYEPDKISEEEIEESVRKSGYTAVRLKGMMAPSESRSAEDRSIGTQ